MKLLLATGGSGGHIFPAIQVAVEARSKGYTCLFAGSLSYGLERIQSEGFEYKEMRTCGWKGIKIFQACFLMCRAVVQSMRVLNQFQPQVVLGFGGYSAFPVCVAAWLKGIPVVLHEQNVMPGKANRLLAFGARKICMSFQQSESYYPKKKSITTGCPTHLYGSKVTQQEARTFFNLAQDLFTICVFGGSQGSRHINQVFMRTLDKQLDPPAFQVVHICGKQNQNELVQGYSARKIKHYVTPFLKEMDYAFQAADLIISRAGALTITEIMYFQKAAILVPYPYAGGHQKKNAEILKNSPFIDIIDNQDLKQDTLGRAIHRQRQQPTGKKNKYAFAENGNPSAAILKEVTLLSGV